MAYADWLVSSREWTTQSPTINGGSQDVTAASGGLYLVHPTTASLDLLARVVVAMTAGSVANAAAYVTEQRYVRLTSSGTFSITWGSATTLRDLLGFSQGDLSGASSYTAASRSTLLWSPGKIFTPERSPLDTHGQPVIDASVTSGPGGKIVSRQHGDPSVVNTYTARYVELARFWGTRPTAVAGQWRHFWEQEIWTAQRMIVVRQVSEGSSTTASAGYSSSAVLGPYNPDLTNRDLRRMPFTREAGFERVEAYYPVSVPVVQTSEFS